MPELPDVVTYLDALAPRIRGQVLERVRIVNPFVLRSAVPPITDAEGQRVLNLRRLGKRIVLALESDLFLIFHLMIAGRLRWLKKDVEPPARITLATFEFPTGLLAFTEAGTKRRASLHLVSGETALAQHDPGGLEVLETDLARFAMRLSQENHTLKRALTDPRLFSGIGNAYSDEILHRAKLSPLGMTQKMSAEEVERLYRAIRETLTDWIDRLREQTGAGFPEKVTAFRPEMAVHGRYGKSCPTCGTKVARIVYAENETNYCPRCQTRGVILADRSLSRLLKKSWPRNLDELE
ncbi:MAG TPA: DNA-formamidopyrimidine glycosylase family protein [Burkholderiales bacterium]|nr:DNA-formamidopyrimidine glycosylase family protein [Burkholderiales bacterium]